MKYINIKNNSGLQGDVALLRVDALPEDVKLTERKDKIVTHSGTGHHHVAKGSCVVYDTPDQLVGYIAAKGDFDVVHLRSWDTHKTHRYFANGGMEVLEADLPAAECLEPEETEHFYEIRRQREWTP